MSHELKRIDCSGIVCIADDCKRHSATGELYCGEHGGPPEYMSDLVRAALERLEVEVNAASERMHADDAYGLRVALDDVRALVAPAADGPTEPHEDTDKADLAASALGSEWHEHPIDDGHGHRFIWKHRHERPAADGLDCPACRALHYLHGQSREPGEEG